MTGRLVTEKVRAAVGEADPIENEGAKKAQ